MQYQKNFLGVKVNSGVPRIVLQPRKFAIVAKHAGKKIDLKKQGVEKVSNVSVQHNLKGISPLMNKKGWLDASGREGKGYGVYRFSNKYGANVDGYSPIFTPDIWSSSGDTYQLGSRGLLAWFGLIVVLLAVGVNLIVSTSQVGY